jgi:hypothetical protein
MYFLTRIWPIKQKKIGKKIKSIISTIIICAIHDLPLRGKTDKTAVFNDLLKFRQEADDLVLLHHLNDGTKNASYVSHRTQNEIIDICATSLRSTIIEDVKKNEMFSILADKTKNVAGVKQLSLVVRYFESSTKCIREDFLGWPYFRGA